jgi:hypothetical protein
MIQMKHLLLLLMSVLLFGVACGDTAVAPPDTDVQPAPETETDDGIFPRPTVTPDAADTTDGYPAPETAPPVTDYPAPEPAPTLDPYPVVAGYVWVVHPLGEQCEDDRFYDDVNAAIAALEAADIEVDRGVVTNLNVCLACGCPTSEHYRLHIAEADLSKAEALGWALFTEDEG